MVIFLMNQLDTEGTSASTPETTIYIAYNFNSQKVLAEVHLCFTCTCWGVKDCRIYFLAGFFTHTFGALVLTGFSYSTKYHIPQGLSMWLILFTAWWLHGRHNSVAVVF